MRTLSALLSVALVACAAGPAPEPRPVDPSVADSVAPGTIAESPASAASAGESDPVEAVPEGSYRIVLVRPRHVGDKAKMVRTVTEIMQQRSTLSGKVVSSDTRQRMARLQGVIETLAVDARGRASKSKFTVEKFEARGPKGFVEVVPPKTVLTVEKRTDKQGSISSSSGPLSETQEDLVRLVISTRASRVGDDDIFGSTSPRAPGDSWPIHADKARSSLADEAQVAAGTLQGNTTLVGAREYRGVPCIELLSRLEAGDVELKNLPAGTTTERGVLRVRASGLFPTNAKLPPLRQSLSMTMEVRTRTPSARGTLITDVSSKREGEVELEPLD